MARLKHIQGEYYQVLPCNRDNTTEAIFHPFMSLISEYDFDKLRNLIIKEIGLQNTCEHFNEIYDFLGSEGTLINYLKTINLCNDKYNTTFHCHLYEKNFYWKCMIGSICCIIQILNTPSVLRFYPQSVNIVRLLSLTTLKDSAVNLYPSLLF